MTWTSFTCGGKYVIGDILCIFHSNKSIHYHIDLFTVFYLLISLIAPPDICISFDFARNYLYTCVYLDDITKVSQVISRLF